MNNGSDTPRTDAEAMDGWSGDAVCVNVEFARTLEREAATMRAALEQTLAHVGVPQENRDTKWHADGNRIYRLAERAIAQATTTQRQGE